MLLWPRLTGSRWDSSDPDRAPPPLPLNPQSPSLTSRAGTSSAIQSAHAALSERARENNALVPSLAKRMGEGSPERPSKNGTHRRLQSLQPGSVRDLSLMIEHGAQSPNASPTRSPDKLVRPSTPTSTVSSRDSVFDLRPYERESNNSSPTLTASSLTPIVRPTVRRPPPQSILGENTPPQSSTMLALQNMGSNTKESESPLSNITNGPTAKVTPAMDNLSHQILSLTSIATSLQKEMSQLSRRSRDNATDLLSLKEATNTRDEDIRKSLRDLLGNINDQSQRLAGRDQFGGYYLDNKPHCTSPTGTRGFHLPRIPSPKSFADSIDRASISTPSLVGVDSSGSVALLEKILRGLGTRDGQDSLLGHLMELSDKLSGLATASKVDELTHYVQAQTESAMVPANNSGRSMSFGYEQNGDHGDHLINTGRSSAPPGKGGDILNDDLLSIIRSVKDSVAQGGGMTAEVKALVRELRGEVLGMGRELGKRLDNAGRRGGDDTISSSQPSKDDVSRVIDEGLEQMKEQLNHVLREHRRQSAASASSQKSAVDYQEIYNALRTAIRDNEADQDKVPDLCRDDVIEAVRDAWENYKPEIEVQQIGLERDEVLACLTQGLREYETRNEKPEAATRDEVFVAVVEGLKHYVPPQVDSPETLSRDEIIDAVRECLEEFEFPVATSAMVPEFTQEDMLHAVREGLSELDLPRGDALVATSSNNEELVSRLHDLMEFMKLEFRAVSDEAKENVAANGRDTEQVLDATKDGLENLRQAIESYVDRANGVASQEQFMDGLLQTMQDFKEEVAGLVAHANEQSRDQLQEFSGLVSHANEQSRDQFQNFTNLVAQASEQSREQLEEVAGLVAQRNETSQEQLQTQLEGLRDIVNSSMVPAPQPAQMSNNKEVLEVLQNGLTSLRQEILRPRPETSEILDALNDGLNDLRAGIDRMAHKPVDLTANDEILDALRAGLDSVRSDIESMRESSNDRAVVPISTAESLVDNHQALIPVDMLKQDDIKNLEVLISQLQLKVESKEEPEQDPSSINKADLAHLEEMLRNVQQGIEDLSAREPPAVSSRAIDIDLVADAKVEVDEEKDDDEDNEDIEPVKKPRDINGDVATREDVEAIETILRNTKGRLEDLIDGEQAVRKEHIDIVETLLLETRESMRSLTEQVEGLSALSSPSENTTQHEDVASLLSLVTQVTASLDEMKERAEKELENPEKVSKTDIEAVETVALEIKTALDGLMGVDFTTIPSKADIANVDTVLKEAKETLDHYAGASTKALEDRQAEILGVGERVSEVKVFLEEFSETVQSKLVDGSTGIEAVGKLLEAMGEKIDNNENVGQDIKDMFDTMKSEFEVSKEIIAGARIESDEKLEIATANLGTKVDDKINELIAKYDAHQAMLDEKAEVGEARDAVTEAALVGTKAVADELKLLVDTLGSTVTDSLEKMEEASKTVFTRVEDMAARADECYTEDKSEHQQTRDHIKQAITAVEGLTGEVNEHQPKMMDTLKEILLMVAQHYEHSKSSNTEIQDKLIEARSTEETLQALLPPPPEKYDDSEVRDKLSTLVEQRYDDTEVHMKLNLLAEQKYDDSEVRQMLGKLIEDKYEDSTVQGKLDRIIESTYDDSGVREKLDTLIADKYEDVEVHQKLERIIDHNEYAFHALSQLETLDKVHQSVVKTAAEMSEFLSNQTQRTTDDREDREKTLQETTISLERALAEKDHVEASVLSLRDEEERLRKSLLTLRTEQESLIRQKTRLTGDVSSLETALRLRKEELYDMEHRAESLERRIIDGVMDHSRVLLFGKAGKNGATDAMSRKRVKKPLSDETKAAKSSSRPAMAMALSKRNMASPGQNGAARRIVSLSQMSTSPASSGVKRSQSVRTPAASKAHRKRSWGGVLAKSDFDEEDKENLGVAETVEELEEPELETTSEAETREDSLLHDSTISTGSAYGDDVHDDHEHGENDTNSDTDTLRRASRGTTVVTTSTDMYPDSEIGYSGYSEYDETGSEYTESAVRTEVDADSDAVVVYGQ